LRLAIVTATGRVSAHLMRIQLDKVLPHGTKYLMLTGDKADEPTLARTDLVVATPDVDITTLAVGDVPVIQLGQVFDPAELISRMSRLNLRGHVDLQLTGAHSSLLMSMLSPDSFMAMPAGTDYWSATEALVAYLIDQGLVDESF
ncbi:PTS fructose transporter subunit IIA, partial [Staphylococcus aureus]|nr:PTS fructose transporter subunit IIA [Staphylococcus aureus]